jgi:hypothetical protein
LAGAHSSTRRTIATLWGTRVHRNRLVRAAGSTQRSQHSRTEYLSAFSRFTLYAEPIRGKQCHRQRQRQRSCLSTPLSMPFSSLQFSHGSREEGGGMWEMGERGEGRDTTGGMACCGYGTCGTVSTVQYLQYGPVLYSTASTSKTFDALGSAAVTANCIQYDRAHSAQEEHGARTRTAFWGVHSSVGMWCTEQYASPLGGSPSTSSYRIPLRVHPT